MKPTIASNRSAGNWFSTLTCAAIASGTSANPHLIVFTHPSAHATPRAVKRCFTNVVAGVSLRESLRCSAIARHAARLRHRLEPWRNACQGENAFPEDVMTLLFTACVYRWTPGENLGKTSVWLRDQRLLRAADQSQPQVKQSRSEAASLHKPPLPVVLRPGRAALRWQRNTAAHAGSARRTVATNGSAAVIPAARSSPLPGPGVDPSATPPRRNHPAHAE